MANRIPTLPNSFPGFNLQGGNPVNFMSPSLNNNSFLSDPGAIGDPTPSVFFAANKSQNVSQSPSQSFFSFFQQLISALQSLFKQNNSSGNTNPVTPTPAPNNGPSDSNIPSISPTSAAHNLREAAAHTHAQAKPVIRGDEAKLDAQVHDQASFGRLADQVAKDYGLDPNQFRAQLQAESAAFSNGYKQAMHHEGDLGRRSENNTSIGLGQISRKFLDGRDWSGGFTGSAAFGKQVVSTKQYMNSVTTQLRMAAASDAMRIRNTGSLDGALRQYVSGHKTADSQNQIYIDNINRNMQNEQWMNVGR